MNITNKPAIRIIKNTDYIPLQVRTEKECQAAEYINIRKSDHSLLELAFDKSDFSLCRITLLICADFRRLEEEYIVPINCLTGDVSADSSDEIETDTFYCEIFSNAVKITVSDSPTGACVVSENVVFELSEKGELISLCVLDSSGRASDHCNRELTSTQNNT